MLNIWIRIETTAQKFFFFVDLRIADTKYICLLTFPCAFVCCCRKGKINQTEKRKMSKNGFIDFNVVKEEISNDNVLAIAEVVAFAQVKYLIGCFGAHMQDTLNDLCKDIRCKKDIKHSLSDAYDLVQECALCLCEHYGQYLTDVIGHTNKGKKITVRTECIKRMIKLINLKARDESRHISLSALTRKTEPRTEMELEQEQDYTQYDNIVNSLNLTENMSVALECRIKGLSYPEIGKILERAGSTVYEYFVKMRQRYIAIYG